MLMFKSIWESWFYLFQKLSFNSFGGSIEMLSGFTCQNQENFIRREVHSMGSLCPQQPSLGSQMWIQNGNKTLLPLCFSSFNFPLYQFYVLCLDCLGPISYFPVIVANLVLWPDHLTISVNGLIVNRELSWLWNNRESCVLVFSVCLFWDKIN